MLFCVVTDGEEEYVIAPTFAAAIEAVKAQYALDYPEEDPLDESCFETVMLLSEGGHVILGERHDLKGVPIP